MTGITIAVRTLVCYVDRQYKGEVRLAYQAKERGLPRRELFVPVETDGVTALFKTESMLSPRGDVDSIDEAIAAATIEHLSERWERFFNSLTEKVRGSSMLRQYWSEKRAVKYNDAQYAPFLAGALAPKKRPVVPWDLIPLNGNGNGREGRPRYKRLGRERRGRGGRTGDY